MKFGILFNQVIESATAALQALNANRMRTFLSTLGVTIGIFCIIMVLTIVESLEINLQTSVESLGKDVVFVEKWPWEFGPDYKWWKYMKRPNPTLNELKSIQEKSENKYPSILTVDLGGKFVKFANNSANGVNIQGVSHLYSVVRNFDLIGGRYFTEAESNNGNDVCLIGSDVFSTLFPSIQAIGQHIQIDGKKYEVIGVFKKEGESIIGNSLDNVIVIPVGSAAKIVRINSDRANSRIHVKATQAKSMDEVENELRGIMRSLRKIHPGQEENFALNKTTLISEPLKQTFAVVSMGGWIIGGFAMLVGGFGIANIMFVSVKERTNQIGIKKSLGAKNYFILIEFLTEAILLCVFGGIVGISIVYVLTLIIQHTVEFNVFLTSNNVLTGLMVSIIIGTISGFLPAWSASKLNPVDAIRSK